MLDAFTAYLDKMYWDGYAQELEENNPAAFYSQLKEFKYNHQLSL